MRVGPPAKSLTTSHTASGAASMTISLMTEAIGFPFPFKVDRSVYRHSAQ
jgi:hypothetical protein